MFNEINEEEISFFFEDVDVFFPYEQDKLTKWISTIIKSKGFDLSALNYIFCSDKYLHQINVEYLNHDYYTDIITFDQSDKNAIIEGDLYISLERVKDNAIQFGKEYNNELCRVIIHGVLHLCGLKDKTEEEATIMRQAEEEALSILT